MKKIILILCICATCIGVKAQEKKNFRQKLLSTADLRVGGLDLKGKGFAALDLTVSWGYNFNKYINARIPVGLETALFKEGGVRDWAYNGTLGLGLGIIPFRFEDDDEKYLLELCIAAGSTYRHEYDWQYTYYDFGVYLADGKICSNRKGQVGFGIRYYDARKSANRMTFYVSFGYRIN